jgi:hypothetical protein
MDDGTAAHAPITDGKLMECLDIFPGISQMPDGSSQPGSRHIRLDSGKPPWNMSIPWFAPTTEQDSSLIHNAKAVELVRFKPCKWPPKLIII